RAALQRETQLSHGGPGRRLGAPTAMPMLSRLGIALAAHAGSDDTFGGKPLKREGCPGNWTAHQAMAAYRKMTMAITSADRCDYGVPGRNRTCNLPLGGESYIHLTTGTKGISW